MIDSRIFAYTLYVLVYIFETVFEKTSLKIKIFCSRDYEILFLNKPQTALNLQCSLIIILHLGKLTKPKLI